MYQIYARAPAYTHAPYTPVDDGEPLHLPQLWLLAPHFAKALSNSDPSIPRLVTCLSLHHVIIMPLADEGRRLDVVEHAKAPTGPKLATLANYRHYLRCL